MPYHLGQAAAAEPSEIRICAVLDLADHIPSLSPLNLIVTSLSAYFCVLDGILRWRGAIPAQVAQNWMIIGVALVERWILEEKDL